MWFAAGFNWMAVDVSGCGLIGVGLEYWVCSLLL